MTKKPKYPRHQRARLVYEFQDGSQGSTGLIETTDRLIRQFVHMAESDDPILQAGGTEKLRMVAEFCVAGQLFLRDQKAKTGKPRKTITADFEDTSATEIAKNLAKKCDSLGNHIKPKELWPEYISALDELGLNPKDDKFGVDYEGGRTSKSTFRKILSRARSQK